ncbi:MAG: aminoglycoside phosphotransferase family protein [Caldilinea sp. CFX5]|nr:aminoglycoside phosphotransferase family protein [Caldilinea sp. CFX5]
MDELTTAIHTYLTTAPISNFLQRDVAMLEHWEGSNNLLWRVNSGGQEAVVKLYLDAGQARGRRQFDGQQLFSPLGLAPPPLWFDRYPAGLSRQVLVYRWAPGDLLNPADATQLLALAQSVAQVHNYPLTDVRRFCPNPVNLDYFWKVWQGGLPTLYRWLAAQGAAALQAILAQLAAAGDLLVQAALPLWANTPATPVHGDLKLENCLNSFGAALLLDWEMFGLGDPSYEVATFLNLSNQVLDGGQQADWLESYLALVAQPGLDSRIAVYRRLLPLQAVTFLLDGLRQHAGEDIALLQQNQAFLAATLAAAIQQCVAALQCPVGDVTTPVDALLVQLAQPTTEAG